MNQQASIMIVGLALLIASCAPEARTQTGSPATPPSKTTPPVSPEGTGSPREIDRAFIDMMVPHHQSAVEMAKIAKERADHEELLSLADEIISAQESEIADLKAWRAAWFGSDETPPMNAMPIMPGVEMPGMPHAMDGATMDMTADIAMLRTAEPFDKVFMETMIGHHQSAIAAAAVVLPQTQRPEIRSMAEDVIASQQAEIDEMESWLVAWYPEAS